MCPLNLHSAVYGDSIKLKIVALLDMYIWLSAFQKIWTTCKSPLKVLLGGNSTLKLYTEWKYTNLHKYLRIKQKLPKSFVVPSCVRNSCNTYCPCDTWSLYQVIMILVSHKHCHSVSWLLPWFLSGHSPWIPAKHFVDIWCTCSHPKLFLFFCLILNLCPCFFLFYFYN